MAKKEWSLSAIWNKALEKTEEKPVEPRDRMWASELGRSDVDIFLKMNGEQPTNPPNDRSYRKFHAGDLYEWFVFLILKKCGILVNSQQAVKNQMEGCVEVSGRLDFIAGGMPDYVTGQQRIDELIDELEMPPLFHKITSNFIAILKEEYPDGLVEKVLEVKSVATFGFDKVETTGKPLAGHELQNFHYARGLNMEGSLCYICRDDMRMYEIPIFPHDTALLEKYKEKVERVSKYYFEKQMPPPEPLVLFDEEQCKFSRNFNVQYSPFLTKLYNIERPDVYEEMVTKPIASWNRVLGRISQGKTMTAKNLEALDGMRRAGFDADKITAKARTMIIIENNEEENI